MENLFQFTEKEIKYRKERLATAKQQLENSINDMQAARENGDLSENSDYDAARDRYRELHAEIAKLQNELSNCEVVHDDNSPIIKIGSTVQVTHLDNNNNPISAPRVFVVGQSGDTVIRKTLGATSPLGKVIIGKSQGIFDIVCNGKQRYEVKKILDEDK